MGGPRSAARSRLHELWRATGARRRALAASVALTVLAAASISGAAASLRATAAAAQSAPAGLVAGYAFDEGSGATAADESGNGHTGTIAGATWTTGRFGAALAFNGQDAAVSLPSLGTFYQGGFTLEAWVKKDSATQGDVTVVGTWTATGSGGPMIWVDHQTTRYRLTLNQGMSNYLDSGQSPQADVWQHMAATFDGTTARFYVDGVEVASRTVDYSVGASDVWRVGAYGTTATGFFDGVIDEVRVYDRALTASEVQADMNTPVSDATPPSAPGTLTATSAGSGEADLAWGAASDNVGVARYNVHRSTSAGFTPGEGNRIAQPTGTSYTDSGLPGGTFYYRVTAEDAAGNVGPPSNEASVTISGDSTPPSVSLTEPPAGASLSGVVTVSASASDDVGVAGVRFLADGRSLGAEDTSAPYSLAWDTRGELNGAHTLTAIARDAAGNETTSAPVEVSVSNSGVSPAGLRAAYTFDEGSGTTAADASGNNQTATLAGGAGWTSEGHFGAAVSLNGTSAEVDPPALGTFYKTGLTLQAWVFKQSSKTDVAVLGSWVGGQGGGPMLWVDHVSGRYRLTLGSTFGDYLDSGQTPAVGRWQHVAATYDGTTARIYVDGVEAASSTFTGNVGDSNTWRIGAYGSSASGFFDGHIDNVRIYDRALSASEIEVDMASRIQPDGIPPTVTAFVPQADATGVNVGTTAKATFSEPMEASTITTSTFKLIGPTGSAVAASVSYDSATDTATLTPQSALQYGQTYTILVEGGQGGVTDLSGNPLAEDATSSFTTEASATPILVVSGSNKFGTYLTEILRNEGLNAFTTLDVSLLSAGVLGNFDVVVLGQTSLTSSQVTMLTNWVTGGGNLIAMRPDKKLAALLGLLSVSGTLSNAYIKVDTATEPGAGIVGDTIQYHGTADRYSLAGASAVAMLYSGASTSTLYPAVTLQSVGLAGGQAAAFTYDLARSVVYTRQGNPAWAGQERDGVPGIRPSDMFYSNWLNTNKIAIPQADEQQRLLANLITLMEQDRMPMPRFWYLPRGEKAVVVMSGDDHSPSYAPGGTAFHFDRFKALSSPGCVVALWECIRSTSYVYPDSALTNAQAASYVGEGFEVALHPVFGSCPTTVMTQSELGAILDNQLGQWAAQFTSIPSPVSSRSHCVYWPDWASKAKVELAHGIRLDANYYHFPASWIGSKPGFMTGGGFPMRFADTDGSLIDVYQLNTNMNDEAGQEYPATVDALLDNALGPQGFYGAFGTNIHTDDPIPNPRSEAIVASAQARGVPVISYKQMLDWTDGRNASSIHSMTWSTGTLRFGVNVGEGATGLQAMLPVQGPNGTLATVTRGGAPVPYTVETIKGFAYAIFDASTGEYEAFYS